MCAPRARVSEGPRTGGGEIGVPTPTLAPLGARSCRTEGQGAPAAQQRTQGEVPSSLGYTFTFGLEIRVAELGSRFPSAQLPGGAAVRC